MTLSELFLLNQSYRSSVVSVLEHLRCQVLRRAAEGLGRRAEGNILLAQAKVGNFNVALAVQQKVLQLKRGKRDVNFSSIHKTTFHSPSNLDR